MTKTKQSITIYQGGNWAGRGTIDAGGNIQDCSAILGPSGLSHEDGAQQDAAERAYEAIESAIEDGDETCECEGCTYTWDIREE